MEINRNKRAIITGASRGIGRAIALELAKRYCSGIVISDIAFADDDTEKAAADFKAETGIDDLTVIAVRADVSKFEDAERTVRTAVETLGGVDILVNNAGITRDNLLLRMSEDDFTKVINVNLNSVFNHTKAVLRTMIKQRYGKIVNIASVVGVIGNAGQANYSASKAGVIGFTKSTAKELASRNINVNAIAPGFIETAMTNKLSDEQKAALLKNVPIPRMGKPEDIAKAAAFLCGEDADYLTGQVINVDGGMVM